MDDRIRADLKEKKILVIYTEMDDWSEEDKITSFLSVDEMIGELTAVGFKNVFCKRVIEPVDRNFSGFDPRETIVFNWTESWGNDASDYWTVPECLEKLGFAYTGSNPACLKETIDKVVTKKKLLANNISTPKTKIYLDNEPNGWNDFPAIVKPAREHCSTGITREAVVDDQGQLHERIKYVLTEYGPHGVLVEDFIEGNEYNVAVWGNDRPEVLPIGMIDFSGFADYHDRICSFNAKWAENSEEWNKTPVICPAPINETLRKKLADLALDTYKLFGIRDYARIDMRVRDGIPYVLDVNSNPDITTSGGLVRSIRKAGYSYGEGVARILELAAVRMPK